MPELPEVQTVVNDLIAAGLTGATIKRARIYWRSTIAGLSAEDFLMGIKGCKISTIYRRAKYIVFDFDNKSHLLIHLRMTGRLHLSGPENKIKKHEHVIFELNDGRHLRFHDTRKFGRIFLTKNPYSIFDRLGPEPLSHLFTARKLAAKLRAHKRMLKPLLLDQAFIAGLGNIYVDEALWDAKVHPKTQSDTFSDREIQVLHRAIRKVLRRGLKNLGTTLGNGRTNFYSVAKRRGRNSDQLRVFRRDGSPCFRCKTEIERILVGQRATHFCPICQPEQPCQSPDNSS
jgi:formamidopyrimidine-DNA glycosylase